MVQVALIQATQPPVKPALDAGFRPAALWNRAYRRQVEKSGQENPVAIALLRPDGTGSCYRTVTFPPDDKTSRALTLRYLERILKFLLWQRGGTRVVIAGADPLLPDLAARYGMNGERAFDASFFSRQVFDAPFEICACPVGEVPDVSEGTMALGRHLDGCRIGFDLGGSDRKCAAVIDGKVVFSEEVPWDPYFMSDPAYHIEGIHDSLKRAAAHLPRVDAIGGSAAGVYVNNEVRVASLFRGVSPEDFETKIRRIFFELKERWNDVPFEVVNDGEVTALAGSMSMGRNAVLGVAMGTSEAAGYVTPDGNITPWLNELAFAPVDYREDAPAGRVVGRPRLRRAVLLTAGGGAAGPGGRPDLRWRHAACRAAGKGADPHEAGRCTGGEDLCHHRHLFRLHPGPLRRLLRDGERAAAGAGGQRRRRRDPPGERPNRA